MFVRHKTFIRVLNNCNDLITGMAMTHKFYRWRIDASLCLQIATFSSERGLISHLNGFGKLSHNQLLLLAYRGVETGITDLVILAFHVGLMAVSLPEASRGGPMLKQCMIYAIMMYMEFPARNRPGHILRRTTPDVQCQ